MLDLYQVPEIVFIYDETYEKAESLDAALKREQASIDKAKGK